jgi:N-acetyl-anhydromuramyl-L-alanine amidase AmpD
MDGTAEHLLDDNAVAWHAGNWDINLQSLGLVFQCDCDKHAPVPEAMEIMARIVAEYMIKYDIPPDHVIGHRDVHKKNGQLIQKSCPGNWWVEKGGDDLTGHERFMRRAVEIRDEMVRSKK